MLFSKPITLCFSLLCYQVSLLWDIRYSFLKGLFLFLFSFSFWDFNIIAALPTESSHSSEKVGRSNMGPRKMLGAVSRSPPEIDFLGKEKCHFADDSHPSLNWLNTISSVLPIRNLEMVPASHKCMTCGPFLSSPFLLFPYLSFFIPPSLLVPLILSNLLPFPALIPPFSLFFFSLPYCILSTSFSSLWQKNEKEISFL